MAASINLTSSFPSGNQIPSNARDNVFCTGANDSPSLLWTLTDLDPVIQVESFRLICIDTDAAGSGPGGKFIHWKVEDIPPTVFSIGANQVWPVPVTIFPTDYPSGDNANGWHGPCPPSLHNYEIYIEAVIVPEQIQKVGVGVVQSNLFLFTDDPEVDIPHGEPSLDDCEGCPPGFTINPETGLCEQKTVVPADCSENLIPVCKGFMIPNNYGSQPAYFFEPVDLSNPANLPLVKTSGSYDLKYQDSTSLTQTASIPNGDPRHTAIWLNRLNEIGVWGPKSGSSTFPNCLPPELWADELTYPPASLAQMQPTNEWIGFTFCVEIPETKSYSIFAAGDNQVRWSVDGQLILNLSGSTSGVETYRASWIIEVTLTAGTHIFTLEGFNNGQVGAFGCEVYSAPVSDIANYASLAELEAVTVFSSFELVGTEVFDLGEESGCNCPEGYILSNCDGELECVQINQTPVSSCCYRIESCDNPGTFYLIELDENIEQLPLEIGTVYKFSGNPLLTDQGCFQLIELTSCDGTELINIAVEETVGDTCEACTPCYELTDCSNPENTLIIQWDPNSPALVENTAYVFDFAPDTCWTAELQFSPCEGTLYSPTNIVTTYIDCDECLKPCYKLIDCEAEGYPTISTENPVFEVYIGKVIQWQDQLGEDHCATVEKYICKDETWPAEPIVVLDCFDTCEECLPKPVPEPIFELSSRSVRPGYNTPGCPPEYYEKVKCKFSEVAYQEMLSKRYGIETCCDIDERKYDIKHELLKLDALEDPYLCNPICTTYTYSVYLTEAESADVSYVDCEGVQQTMSRSNTAGVYSVEICALTTFTPVITITREDSSVEQYKLDTSFGQCCLESCGVLEITTTSEPMLFGEVVTFTKTDFGDEVDVIIPGELEITRGNNKGIYNSVSETTYDDSGYTSPADTQWASCRTEDVENPPSVFDQNDPLTWSAYAAFNQPNYGYWADARDFGDDCYFNGYDPATNYIVGQPFVMKHVLSGRYWRITFTAWTGSNAGGGFTYERQEFVNLPNEGVNITYTPCGTTEEITENISGDLLTKLCYSGEYTIEDLGGLVTTAELEEECDPTSDFPPEPAVRCATYTFTGPKQGTTVRYTDCNDIVREVGIDSLNPWTDCIIEDEYEFIGAQGVATNTGACEAPELIISRYEFTIPPREFGDLGGSFSYVDQDGITQIITWPDCADNRNCPSQVYVFCAVYGTFKPDTVSLGVVTVASNEDCPDGLNPFACFQDPRVVRLGDCT